MPSGASPLTSLWRKWRRAERKQTRRPSSATRRDDKPAVLRAVQPEKRKRKDANLGRNLGVPSLCFYKKVIVTPW